MEFCSCMVALAGWNKNQPKGEANFITPNKEFKNNCELKLVEILWILPNNIFIFLMVKVSNYFLLRFLLLLIKFSQILL